MKIAFIVRGFPKISETFILNQITGMIDLGHDVEIFAFKKLIEGKKHPDIDKYNLMDKVKYLEIPKNKISRISRAFNIFINSNEKKSLIRSLNFFKYRKDALFLKLLLLVSPFVNSDFDIIHCFFGPTGIFGVKLKEICCLKSKIVTSFHGYDISRYLNSRGFHSYNHLFEKGDIFLPVCSFFKKRLIELGCKKNKIIVHRTGIDLQKFKFSKKTSIEGKVISIISIGRLVEKKGFLNGIMAINKVLKKYPDIQYAIYGEGRLKIEILKLIEELNLSNKIKIMGYKNSDEIIKAIRGSDILIAPSMIARDGDCEGIPNALKEAMAVGVPVISTYHGGINELITDKYSGFLVPERDIDSLAEKICFVIQNYEKINEIIMNARKMVDKYYDIKKLNLKQQGIYLNLIDNFMDQ
jgi:colanic acid/amylovoran biosynthesis glycosyltransferase